MDKPVFPPTAALQSLSHDPNWAIYAGILNRIEADLITELRRGVNQQTNSELVYLTNLKSRVNQIAQKDIFDV